MPSPPSPRVASVFVTLLVPLLLLQNPAAAATEANPDPDRILTTTATYDHRGRVIATTDAAGHTTRRTYDALGNVRTVTDPDGQTTTFHYDALNRLTRTIGPNGEWTERTYDADSNLTSYRDANGNLTTYEHDALGRRIRTSYPQSGLVYTWSYDPPPGELPSHLPTLETRPDGTTVAFRYDRLDRLIARTIDNGVDPPHTETFAYDRLGRTTRGDNPAATVERSWDALDNLRREDLTYRAHGVTKSVAYGYAPNGADRTSVTYPSGGALGLTHDVLGRIDQMHWQEPGQPASPLADYDYRGPGRLQRKTVGAVGGSPVPTSPVLGSPMPALVGIYQYDGERLLSGVTRSIVTGTDARTIAAEIRSYTARHELERLGNPSSQTATAFDYDEAGRLTAAAYAVPQADPDASNAKRTAAFTVDPVRNIEEFTRRIKRGETDYTSAVNATHTTGNRIATFDGEPLTYDSEGNLTGDHAGRSLEYDIDNRLTKVTADDATTTHSYDPFHRRITTTTDGVTALHQFDGWQHIESTDVTGTVVTARIHNGRAIDEPLEYRIGAGPRYRLVQDQSGNVTHVVDEDGQVVEAYTYLPYGRFRRHGQERVDHIRLASGKLRIRFTAGMDLTEALANEYVTLAPPIEGEWQPSADQRELEFTPDDNWPGQPVTVAVSRELRSLQAIEQEEETQITFDGADPVDQVLIDEVAPGIELVAQDLITVEVEEQEEQRARVRIEFTEPMQDATRQAVTLRLGPLLLPIETELSPDCKTLQVIAQEPAVEGALHTLELTTQAGDLQGNPAEPGQWAWNLSATPHRIEDAEERALDPNPPSLVGNRWFFQGRELDPSTGLYDFRHRWYSAELGRWLTKDPLGYPDGPNQYAAFGADPNNWSDPLGTDSTRQFALDYAEARLDDGGIWNSTRAYGALLGYSLLNTVTVGFATRHDDFWELEEAGAISRGEYWSNGVGISAARSAAILGLAAATGGFGAGLGQGLGLSTSAQFAMAGGGAGLASVAGSDMVDIGILHESEDISPWSTYAFAGALGAVGGAMSGRFGGLPRTPNQKGVSGEQQVADQTGLRQNVGTGRERFAIPNRFTPTGRQSFTYPDFKPSQTIPQRGTIVDAKNVAELDYGSGNIRALHEAAAARGAALELRVRAPGVFSVQTRVLDSMLPHLGHGPGRIQAVPSIDPLGGARPPLLVAPQAAEEQR